MSGSGGLLLILIVGAIWLACRSGGGKKRVSFHGHGDTRGRAVKHENRHKKVLRGLGIRTYRPRVWEEEHGWAGLTTIKKSDEHRWDALSKEKQAAVYMAGAVGGRGIKKEHCSDDLAEVDARTDRRTAARIARRYL